MKTYFIQFRGRKNNAIGVTYPIVETVTAKNKGAAILSLYDSYEHIMVFKIQEVRED